MARVICGISNIPFKCSYVPMTLSNREYMHPIFMLKQRNLIKLYTKYNRGELTDIDSYLLFLALLKSTDAVEFVVPAQITTSTPKLIANNIGPLISVIFETNAIIHPKFKQPKFFVRHDTANLDNIKVWINAWQKNIEDLKSGYIESKLRDRLTKVENKLSKLIFTPEAGQVKLAAATADWADTASEFPNDKKELWKAIIRKAFNLEAMFSTDKKDIIELKEHCENNIEAGSIHYYTLMKTIRTALSNHNDFLGLGYLGVANDTPDCGYTLLPPEEIEKGETALLNIIANAPDKEPIKANYPNKLAYIKAKLAYKEAVKYNATNINNPDLEKL